MFEDLYDAVSLSWSWKWPIAEGKITAVDVERRTSRNGVDNMRLAVAYEFSVGDDGPYTGESFWAPSFFRNRRVIKAKRKIRVRQTVVVHYRPDNPSINKLDRTAWDDL
jgi:hypothetical protein